MFVWALGDNLAKLLASDSLNNSDNQYVLFGGKLFNQYLLKIIAKPGKLLLTILVFAQFVLAAGSSPSNNVKYILTDFELTVSEQQKIKISTDKLTNARAEVKNFGIVLVHQIGNHLSEELEDLLILLKENNYLQQVNYLYSDSLQQDGLDLQVRLVLNKYLPEVFFKYVKFKKQQHLETSAALYYAGVSPDVVYELVDKYGDDLIKENQQLIQNYVGELPLLYIDGNLVTDYQLVKIIEVLNHRSYQVSRNLDSLKIFVSPEAEVEYLGIDQKNIVRLTKLEAVKIAKQLGIEIFPYAFIDAQPQQLPFLYEQGFIKKADYLVKEGLGKIKFYQNRILLPERVDIFVRVDQPDSLAVLSGLTDLQQENVFLHMMMDSKNLLSEKNQENVRLLYLYKKLPQDFWRYIRAKYQNPEQDWQQLFTDLQIAAEPIEQCIYSEEGERYLKEGLFLINELGIKNTPQILWQNQYLVNSLSDFKKVQDKFNER